MPPDEGVKDDSDASRMKRSQGLRDLRWAHPVTCETWNNVSRPPSALSQVRAEFDDQSQKRRTPSALRAVSRSGRRLDGKLGASLVLSTRLVVVKL